MVDNNEISAIVESNWKKYISKELYDYAEWHVDTVNKLLNGVWWHSFNFWEKLDVIPVWQKVDKIIEKCILEEEEEELV